MAGKQHSLILDAEVSSLSTNAVAADAGDPEASEEHMSRGERRADHKAGHRQRLRTKLVASNGEGMADYELVEMLLCLAIPRRDVKPMAKELLAAFGSYEALISANADVLAHHGLSEAVVAALKLAEVSAVRLARTKLAGKPLLSNHALVVDYLRAQMVHSVREHVRVLYLNSKHMLLADEVVSFGSIAHAPLYPREIIRRAIEVGAAGLIIAHNHPSGSAEPSADDVAVTQALKQACNALALHLHDHIIVASMGTVSLREAGLLG